MSDSRLLALARHGTRWEADFRRYLRGALRTDLFAGASVAMVGAPQCMAYAAVAGINPIYGLYTGIVPTIVASLFGSSRYLVTGPSNATALVTAAVLVPFLGSSHYMEYVFALAILSGIIKLGLGLLRLGNITRYISNSVLTGFLAGAGIQIILTQLGNFFGLPRLPGSDTLTVVHNVIRGLAHLNPYALASGLLAAAIILVSRRLSSRMPGALLAIVCTAVVVQAAGWQERGVALVSPMPEHHGLALAWHIPQIPNGDWQALLSGAGAVALLSLVEALSVAKSLAIAGGERLDASREFVGQGLASLAGGFFQCLPSSGSPTRTAVAYAGGASSRVAGAFSGVLLLGALLIFGSLIRYIPVAGLASVVILSALGLFNWEHIRLTWQCRSVSRMVLMVTFLSTLLLPLQVAIYLGVLLSVGIYLYESSRLSLSYLRLDAAGQVTEQSLDELLREKPDIAVVNVEGALYFGATERLEDQLTQVLNARRAGNDPAHAPGAPVGQHRRHCPACGDPGRAAEGDRCAHLRSGQGADEHARCRRACWRSWASSESCRPTQSSSIRCSRRSDAPGKCSIRGDGHPDAWPATDTPYALRRGYCSR